MDMQEKDVLKELEELKGLVSKLILTIEKQDQKIDELKSIIQKDNVVVDKKDSEEQKVLDSNNVEMCYNYVINHKDADILAFGDVIANSGDLKYNYLFMKNIKECNFNKHLNVILDSKDPEYNYYLALLQLDRPYIEQIRNLIVESKISEYCYEFANDIRHIYGISDDDNTNYDFLDITDLEMVVIENNDIKYSYMFAKNIKGADIPLLQDVILELASEVDVDKVFDFAVDVKGADVNACKSKIVDIYNLASNKKEVANIIDACEKRKIKCLFRETFADSVDIK